MALVGAGGLGAPLALTLGRAGAALTLYDPDVVDPTNLHRQLAFELAAVGKAKARALADAVVRRGGAARAVDARWTPAVAERVDVIVEGSDDPRTKFAVADWALAAGVPAVIAGALGTGGNVLAMAPGSACYRCLFEEPPEEAPTCAQAGVLGPVVAQIAALATCAALALGRGDRSSAGAVWVLDGLGGPPRRLALTRRPDCSGCAALYGGRQPVA